MKVFEYDTERAPSPLAPSQLTILLNERGRLGWELVGFNYGEMIFKRETTQEEIDRRKTEELHRRRRLWEHLKVAHDKVVYIGDVFEIHAEDCPDCEYKVDLSASMSEPKG